MFDNYRQWLLTQDRKKPFAVGKIVGDNSNELSGNNNSGRLLVEVLLQMLKTNPPIQGKHIVWPREFTSKPVRVVGPSGGVSMFLLNSS